MSHPSKVEILRTARALGYRVVVYFVATEDPSINVARVEERVAAGGHDVPREAITGRYTRTMALLYSAVRAAGTTYLFDNSSSAPARSGPERPFRVVGHYESDGVEASKRRIARDVPNWARDNLHVPLEQDSLLLRHPSSTG